MPMLSLARGGYSGSIVQAVLHGLLGTRQLTFRYELLSKTGARKYDLTNVIAASVSHDALGDVKRKAKFTLKDDGTVDFLSDRIKPYARVYIPPGRVIRQWAFMNPAHIVEDSLQDVPANGGWVEFPLGVYLLVTPEESADASGAVIREVEAYDQGQILKDDGVDGRYFLATGTKITDIVKVILESAGIMWHNVVDSPKLLPYDFERDTGTSKLSIVNDLLDMLNYYSVWFDGEGLAIASPYVLPSQAPSEYTYAEGSESVMELGSPRRKRDLYSVPNKWVFTVSQADATELKSVYVNDNPNSPTSTTSRGRIITDFRQVEAADQAALDGLTLRAATDASQVFEELTWSSWVMPQHAHMDNYTLVYGKLNPPVSATFRETNWQMDLRADGRMSHSARRTVTS